MLRVSLFFYIFIFILELFPHFVSAGTTVIVNPENVSAGGVVTVTWSNIANPTARDWIGLAGIGADDASIGSNWLYVNCSKNPDVPLASGSCSLDIPSTTVPGTYEIRLFANGGYNKLATSLPFTITAPLPTVPIPTTPTLTVSPTSIQTGETIQISFNNISNPTAKDWIGLINPSLEEGNNVNGNVIDWLFTGNCSRLFTGIVRGSGTCSLVISEPGYYEMRLYRNDASFPPIAISNHFRVEPRGLLSLSTDKTTLPAGSVVTVSFRNVPNASHTDWIALATVGSPNNSFVS